MIQITGVTKVFGSIAANQAIDLTVKKGEIFGLLGPNGAGKSTLIAQMSALQKPDNGTIFLNGIDVVKNPLAIKKTLGVVPQEISLYDNFSAYDNLLFFGKLHKIDQAVLKRRITEILQLIGLESRKNDLIKTYSGGMKRRINIAVALLHQPKILLMDEPTVGVDPQSRNQIFEVIEKLNKAGLTIIYTTHYMEEVERLCDTIAIMDKGKIIIQGTLNELQQKQEKNTQVTLTFDTITAAQKRMLEEQYKTIKFNTKTVTITDNNLHEILRFCIDTNLVILHIEQQKANLETIFLALTGKSLRD